MGQRVINAFTIAPGLYQLFIPQYSQLLRECRLVDTGAFFQVTDTALSRHQLTEQQQAIRIGQDTQQESRFVGAMLQARQLDKVYSRGHHAQG
jgi:hypothetical protein